jgi:hypothetical protein
MFGKLYKVQLINKGSGKRVRMVRFAKTGRLEGQHLKAK